MVAVAYKHLQFLDAATHVVRHGSHFVVQYSQVRVLGFNWRLANTDAVQAQQADLSTNSLGEIQCTRRVDVVMAQPRQPKAV